MVSKVKSLWNNIKIPEHIKNLTNIQNSNSKSITNNEQIQK